jgi:NAD(P)-dependent dehydrogenase (short-subunit alcohol dehydrogenase family)
VQAFVAKVEEEAGPIQLAVHNIGANVRFDIAETTPRVFTKCWELAALSSLHFAKAIGPKMAERGEGTMIFTGATASLRGQAGFSAFAGAMHAKRALAQSVARELAPSGVHVCHAVIDGPIDTAFVRGLLGEEQYAALKSRGGLLEPEAIADAYWALHEQRRSAWTHELDLRPFCERW